MHKVFSGRTLFCKTIKWYRMRLRVKFKASTSSAVIRQAMKQGLL